jgi:hypothetical protein
MKFLIVQLPPSSRHLIPLRSKYSSQNPVPSGAVGKDSQRRLLSRPRFVRAVAPLILSEVILMPRLTFDLLLINQALAYSLDSIRYIITECVMKISPSEAKHTGDYTLFNDAF